MNLSVCATYFRHENAMCIAMAMLTAAAQWARVLHGVVSQSLRLNRSRDPLIAVRCAANILRIKGSWKAPMNFCEIMTP